MVIYICIRIDWFCKQPVLECWGMNKRQLDMLINYNKVWQNQVWMEMPLKHSQSGTNYALLLFTTYTATHKAKRMEQWHISK